MDLSDVARELYRVPPSEFIAERKAKAAELKRQGNAALATEVGRLSKPSVSAWAVNLLAFDNASMRAKFGDLGSRLREARSDPDRPTVSRLIAERRSLVSAAVTEATCRAGKVGVSRLTQSALDEVEQTLLAALIDEEALDAAFSGRLIRAVEADGFEPVDLEGAVAGGAARHQRAARTGPGIPRPTKRDNARRAAREAADRAEAIAKTATEAVEALNARRAEHDSAAARLAGDVQDLQDRFDELEAQQEALKAQASQLKRELSRAKQVRRRAETDARATRAKADRD